MAAVMDYLEWLGTETEKEVRSKVDAYRGKRRLLKAALFWIELYEQTLSIAMLNGTEKVKGMNSMKEVEVYGLSDPSRIQQRVPTFSFNITGADPHKVAQYLWDKHALAVLAENNGGFYSRALRTYGKSVAVRASPLHFNTIEEVETFLSGLDETVKRFAIA
jgi:selenocysteine lyase/cysteine desulfurase